MKNLFVHLERLALLIMLLGLASCATNKPNPGAIDWSSRVGSYTYDQAIADFGKPDATGETSAGRFAEWITRHGAPISFGLGVGGGSYGHSSGVGVGVGSGVSTRPRGEYLRLTFDKENKLVDWLVSRN